MAQETAVEEKLQKLGMNRAMEKIKQAKEAKRKMMLAYEHYRFITPEKMQAYRDKLAGQRKRLAVCDFAYYDKIPPLEVLSKIEEAIGLNCFDTISINWVTEIKDPIVFGGIRGCDDLFYIAQWDDDVKIEDILDPKDG